MNKFICIVLLGMLMPTWVLAQDDDSSDSGEATELDLFDEDTEYTKGGWIRFYTSFGATRLDADGGFSVIQPDGESVTIIDFDRAGLKETDSSYWLTLNWRSADSRWGAWFGSWEYDVTGSRFWEESLEMPNKDPIPVGASVTSEFDAKWYILEATYSFYRSETIDTGIGFGFHTVDLDTTLTARIELADLETEIVSQQLDTLAPLPNLLVYLHWKFKPRWSLVSRFGYFGLDYRNYSGQMTNAHAMVTYNLSPRWALGLGYQFVDLDLKVDKSDYVQDYNISFNGPLAFLRLSF